MSSQLFSTSLPSLKADPFNFLSMSEAEFIGTIPSYSRNVNSIWGMEDVDVPSKALFHLSPRDSAKSLQTETNIEAKKIGRRDRMDRNLYVTPSKSDNITINSLPQVGDRKQQDLPKRRSDSRHRVRPSIMINDHSSKVLERAKSSERPLPLPKTKPRPILKSSSFSSPDENILEDGFDPNISRIPPPSPQNQVASLFADPIVIKYISRQNFYLSYKSSVRSYQRSSQYRMHSQSNLHPNDSGDDIIINEEGKEEDITRNNITSTASSRSLPSSHSRFFRSLSNSRSKYFEESQEEVMSPRTLYLKNIVKQNLLPMPLILRNRNDPRALSLAHKGLGDAQALVVIEVMDHMDDLTTLDLCDNRLTDVSLVPLVKKLDRLEHLTHLDLSFNKIDQSSSLITKYIMSPSCKLKALILNGADVDDDECVNIANALLENESVTILSLTNNLIGTNESRNFVNPDLITGPEAIGNLLSTNKTLTSLDVSWNYIRKDSAMTVAESIFQNNTLKRLILSNNAFGDEPTRMIGKALKTNESLLELDLSYNSLTPVAATVLANSLVLNENLTQLDVSGNVLGRIGSQALVSAVHRASNGPRMLTVHFSHCDCEAEDRSLFDPSNPIGLYKLDLSLPYDAMVAEECMYLCQYRPGFSINRLEYDDGNGNRFREITLERTKTTVDPRLERKGYRRKLCETLITILNDNSETDEQTRETKYNNNSLLSRSIHKQIEANVNRLKRRMSATKVERNSLDDGDENETRRSVAGERRQQLLRAADASRALEDLSNLIKYLGFSIQNHDGDSLKKLIEKILDRIQQRLETQQSGISQESKNYMKKAERAMKLMTDEGYKQIYNNQVMELESNILSDIFTVLFQAYEVYAGCGLMDTHSFLTCMSHLGVSVDLQHATKLFKVYDLEDSGFIDASQFSTILMYEFCQYHFHRGLLVDKDTKKPWIVPSSGKLLIELVPNWEPVYTSDISHDEGVDAVIRNIRCAHTPDERQVLFSRAITSPYYYFSASQIYAFFEEMGKNKNAPVDLVVQALPHIVNCSQCQHFLTTVLNIRERLKLRLMLGPIYNIFTGATSGHYVFDLSKPSHYKAGKKLCAISSEETAYLQASGIGDTSQKGNNSNFRNEFHNVTVVEVNPVWFGTKEASEGRLRVDYVSTRRPVQGVENISDGKFRYLIQGLGLQDLKTLSQNIDDFLRQETSEQTYSSKGSSSQTSRSNSSRLSTTLASHSETSHGHPSKRHSGPKGKRKIVKAHAAMSAAVTTQLTMDDQDSSLGPIPAVVNPIPTLDKSVSIRIRPEDSNDSELSEKDYEEMNSKGLIPIRLHLPEGLNLHRAKDNFTEYLETCHHYLDILPEERVRDSKMALAGKVTTPRSIRTLLGPRPSITKCPRIYAFALYKIMELQILAPDLFLSVEQVKEILSYFPADVGYLRAQIIQTLFNSIVDLENMYLLLKSLSYDEELEVYHRLGHLNLLDPCMPDRFYLFDLRRWDQREFVKLLVRLGVQESGDAWKEPEFRMSKFDDPIPGWVLPLTWDQPDDVGSDAGPRRYGWLRFTFSSEGEDRIVHKMLRLSLRKKTLLGLKYFY